jgi:hypothetical protein
MNEHQVKNLAEQFRVGEDIAALEKSMREANQEARKQLAKLNKRLAELKCEYRAEMIQSDLF